jgi:mRNA interferase MazF
MVDEYPHRGDIWIVSLEPVIGSETGKKRPALIISNDRNNEFAETVTVIPLTSRTGTSYPFEASIKAGTGGLTVDSKAKCNQVRTVSKARLLRKCGVLSPEELRPVEQALLIHLGVPR